MQGSFFSLYESNGPSTHIHFYTDTAELSQDYGLLGFALRRAAYSVQIGTHRSAERAAAEPLRLAFLGEARDEKGFPWLPDLIDDLMDEYVKPRKVRFLLQANVSAPRYNPRSSETLEQLKQYPREQVELFGVDSSLSPQQYYDLVSQADVVLFPYERNRYRACSSGTLAEAIAGGRPAIVPARVGCPRRLPPGGGETFHDYDSFVEAVKRRSITTTSIEQKQRRSGRRGLRITLRTV